MERDSAKGRSERLVVKSSQLWIQIDSNELNLISLLHLTKYGWYSRIGQNGLSYLIATSLKTSTPDQRWCHAAQTAALA